MKENNKRYFITSLIVIISILFVTSSTYASPKKAPKRPKAVLFLMDNTNWEDWEAAKSPFLKKLIRESSIGQLNSQTGSYTTRSSGFMTISSAAVSITSWNAPLVALGADELYEGSKAKQTYERRIGNAGKNEIFVIGLSSLLIREKDEPLGYIPGNLGQTLSDAGIKTAVLGNSDISMKDDNEYLLREAAVIGMKKNGTVDYGLVDKRLLKNDGKAPFGIRTNEALLLKKTKEMLNKADFVVIDFGDTTRADLYSSYALPGRAYRMRYKAIKRGGEFLKKLQPLVSANNGTLIVAGTLPPKSFDKFIKYDKQQLTPILVNGKGWKPGYLLSGNTQRKSIVTNFNLAPTILEIFKIKKPFTMIGKPLEVAPDLKTQTEPFITFNKNNLILNQSRPVTIYFFIYFQLLIFVICSVLLIKKQNINQKLYKALRVMLLSVIAFPVISYIVSRSLPTLPAAALTILIFVLAVVVPLVIEIMVKEDIFMSFIVIYGAAIGLLATNILFASFLDMGSVFGYDPIKGSRFFGVGNETMSILIASTILFFALMFERFNVKSKWLLSVPLFFAVALLVGFPGLGANTDGATTAVTVFGFALIQLSEGGIRKNWYIVVASVVIFMSAFIGYDVLKGSNSHFGRTFELVNQGGYKEAVFIIKRKLTMNFKILRYSKWSYFLVTTFLLIGVIRARPIGLFKTILNKYKFISLAVTSVIAGGLVGFATNDSGIVIPALMLSYFMPVILSLMLAERVDERQILDV